MLWAPEDSGLANASVLPVEFRSNISQTWIIRKPDSDERIEVPFWRVELYSSKRKALERADSLAELATVYAMSRRDGLVLRDKPEINADQVYRLRIDETIKLLRKVQGALVETGGKELEGAWYLALATDGTSGYVYSNQLALWDAASEAQPVASSLQTATDARMMDLFASVWRPDYFTTMENNGKIDLARYQIRFGIFTDAQRRQVRVELPWFSQIYNYSSIEDRGNGTFALMPMDAQYQFNQRGDLLFFPPEKDLSPAIRQAFSRQYAPLPATLQETATSTPADSPTPGTQATVQPGAQAASTELPRISFVFRKQSGDPRSVMVAEERRRLSVLSSLVSAGEYFESLSHGVLVITATGRFTWMNYGSLIPDIISEALGEGGEVAADLFLHPELASAWQGAISFRFDANVKKPIHFVYKADQNSLTLAPVAASDIQQATVLRVNQENSLFFMRY